MKLITDFYTNLDILNKIIFWGIIIVIILLIIFSSILINKNKKNKKVIEEIDEDESLPIKNENIISVTEDKKFENINIDKLPNSKEQQLTIAEYDNSNFVAEEYIMEYNKKNITNKSINNNISNIEQEKTVELPNKPYQKNVLREMSLSQTSPIGITNQVNKKLDNNEIAKDLQNSLDEKILENNIDRQRNEIIKNEMTKMKENHPRKTEIKTEVIEANSKIKDIMLDKNKSDLIKESTNKKIFKSDEDEILKNIPTSTTKNTKSSSERYLEEVSKKLSVAQTPDDIERTEYELEQEENAIISYKELMKKKDTIKTIEEEEAIISIEELMNRKNNSTDEIDISKSQKLYNITEEEENDEFLKELKKFRKDL